MTSVDLFVVSVHLDCNIHWLYTDSTNVVISVHLVVQTLILSIGTDAWYFTMQSNFTRMVILLHFCAVKIIEGKLLKLPIRCYRLWFYHHFSRIRYFEVLEIITVAEMHQIISVGSDGPSRGESCDYQLGISFI